MRKLSSIGVIWFCCALAWMILGSSVVRRTGTFSSSMGSDVALLWGPKLVQAPPRAVLSSADEQATTKQDATAPASDDQTAATAAGTAPQLDGSDIDVSLALEHRRKGLMWFATYDVAFRGHYTFYNDNDERRHAELRFPLAGHAVVYDAFKVLDGNGEPLNATINNGVATWNATFDAGERYRFTVVYRSRGTTSWSYLAGQQDASQLKNFKLHLSTNAAAIDFPAGTISPTTHHVDDNGWHGSWTFDSLVSSARIAIELPHKLNPGPVVSRITFFAPVSLLFFFFVVAILAAARHKQLHPMHFFMLGCAFFAFHLLFAYLVDHTAVATAFGIAAVVSVTLVVSYARLFVGWRFALLEMGVSQVLYLVLFSYTFFLQGFTGLAITIGAIITLFVMMQITGQLDWTEAATRLRGNKPSPPAGAGAGAYRGTAAVGAHATGATPFHAFTHMPVGHWQKAAAPPHQRGWQPPKAPREAAAEQQNYTAQNNINHIAEEKYK